MDKARLFILSGPASVGKTTVARILAAHLSEKTAIVDGDDVLRFECVKCDNKRLFLTNSRTLINNFLNEEIDVIYSHALTPDEVAEVVKNCKTEEVKVVFLTANLKTLQLRNRTRSTDDQSRLDLEREVQKFAELGIEERFILDNSNLSLSQTAQKIIESDRFILK